MLTTQAQLEEIKVLRTEMKEIAESAKEKDGTIKQLHADLEAVSTQVARYPQSVHVAIC